MIEREHDNLPSAEGVKPEPRVQHIEAGPPVEFGLLPGQHLELSLSRDGLVRLQVTASEAPPPPHSALGEDPDAVDPERAERVTVAGRVGNAPTFRTTPNGVRIAKFLVAEHEDTESTTWRTVLAFGPRAERLDQDPLEKGQTVEVIGYPHLREVSVSGVKRSVEEIYATAIKRR